MGRGTARRAVEGRRGQRDPVGNSVWISQHFAGGDTDHAQAVLDEKGITALIAIRPIAGEVRYAIDLDHEARRSAVEIQGIWPQRMLPPKTRAGRAATQTLPQQPFGQAHRLTQRPGAGNGRDPSTALRAVPLPPLRAGRNLSDHAFNLSLTTAPSFVRRIASPISSSRTGLP